MGTMHRALRVCGRQANEECVGRSTPGTRCGGPDFVAFLHAEYPLWARDLTKTRFRPPGCLRGVTTSRLPQASLTPTPTCPASTADQPLNASPSKRSRVTKSATGLRVSLLT